MAVFTINGSNSASRGRSPAQEVPILNDSELNNPIMSAPITVNADFKNEFQPTFYADTAGKVKPEPATPIEVNVFDPPREVSAADRSANAGEKTADIMEKNQKAQAALAGARFFTGVMNAQSQYNNISAKASNNIFLAHQSASDAISRGKQQALQLEGQGRARGDQATLAMAAQGQDVLGDGVGRIVAGQEAVGYYNSMIAEINAGREALGFEQEAIQYQGQIEQAKIQRNFGFLNSALQFGASTIPLG
jgi:hypothetical protein